MNKFILSLVLLSGCHCVSANENDRDDYRIQRDNPADCQQEKENGERGAYLAYRQCRDAIILYYEDIQE